MCVSSRSMFWFRSLDEQLYIQYISNSLYLWVRIYLLPLVHLDVDSRSLMALSLPWSEKAANPNPHHLPVSTTWTCPGRSPWWRPCTRLTASAPPAAPPRHRWPRAAAPAPPSGPAAWTMPGTEGGRQCVLMVGCTQARQTLEGSVVSSGEVADQPALLQWCRRSYGGLNWLVRCQQVLPKLCQSKTASSSQVSSDKVVR